MLRALGIVAVVMATVGWGPPLAAQIQEVQPPVPGVHACVRRPADQRTEVDILDGSAGPVMRRLQADGPAPHAARTSASVEDKIRKLETWLTTTGRVEVDGIHFDFAKATIRAESEPILQAIADLLIRYPSWKLRVEGHTDIVGGVAANLDLSVRRATAVRQALVYRYFVEPVRLTPVGLGPSRPKDTNRTPEGRAHNRRVELVRQP
jgi:outer membrane protein OmpA-like peptidoglycan-associated protein